MKFRHLLWITLLFMLAVFVVKATCQPQKTVQQGLTEYVSDYLAIYPSRKEKAIKLIPTLIDISKQNDINPFLMAVTISNESSWIETAYNPSKGEKGLTQVHGAAAKGHDLTHSIGQIRAGATWLQRGMEKCRSELGGINYYMTGKGCQPICTAAKRRFNNYQDVWNKYCPNNCY